MAGGALRPAPPQSRTFDAGNRDGCRDHPALESFGYDVQQIGGGVVGILRNGEGGPTALFRADIDALPVEETTGLPYASTKTMADRAGVTTPPVMHACGHDMHITAGLGAAELLAGNKGAVGRDLCRPVPAR